LTGAAAAAVAEATTLTASALRGALAALGAAMVTRATPTAAGALAVATVSTVITLGCEGRAVASAC
jgi:hypothetical protein